MSSASNTDNLSFMVNRKHLLAMLRQKILVFHHDDVHNEVSYVIQSNYNHDVFHRVDSYHIPTTIIMFAFDFRSTEFR